VVNGETNLLTGWQVSVKEHVQLVQHLIVEEWQLESVKEINED
jgi:hypothetical protein